MSSPVNRQGGHIHAIVLAIGAGKVNDEIIKGLFVDKVNKSLLNDLNSKCLDNSFYCQLFNVRESYIKFHFQSIINIIIERTKIYDHNFLALI
ncbi:unnamed protein product [Meloidogyne enterolobii]|uniref:Uncharacterized protein n=1 Tax=Meloidogyne enterolobii TaxID=390850 RepID=A0ACB1AIG0_MELEN